MGSSPIFNVNDTVYLQSSAKIGFLEAYQITSIHQITLNKWVYRILLNPTVPAVSTVGDAISHKNNKELYFDESELLNYSEASQMQIDSLQRRLNAAIAQRIARLG